MFSVFLEPPAKIVTDNGTQFKSHILTYILKGYGVNLFPCYHGQNNPAERNNINKGLFKEFDYYQLLWAYLKDDGTGIAVLST